MTTRKCERRNIAKLAVAKGEAVASIPERVGEKLVAIIEDVDPVAVPENVGPLAVGQYRDRSTFDFNEPTEVPAIVGFEDAEASKHREGWDIDEGETRHVPMNASTASTSPGCKRRGFRGRRGWRLSPHALAGG